MMIIVHGTEEERAMKNHDKIISRKTKQIIERGKKTC